jgi:hypothetical protein
MVCGSWRDCGQMLLPCGFVEHMRLECHSHKQFLFFKDTGLQGSAFLGAVSAVSSCLC